MDMGENSRGNATGERRQATEDQGGKAERHRRVCGWPGGYARVVEIILAARDRELADAWRRQCGDLESVRVHEGSIFDVAADAYVSPANSFGFMDGGIDMAYTQRFGWEIQERLQQVIRDRHHGELLVGDAEIVETGLSRPYFIIAAPTMRVPMPLGETINPFLAARAVLRLIMHGVFSPPAVLAGEPIRSAVQTVALPGLGTGIGRVPADICARQVRAAIEEVVLGKLEFPTSWKAALQAHQLLCTGGDRTSPGPAPFENGP